MGKKAGVKTTSGGRDKPCCFEQGEEKIGLGMIVTTLVIVILVRGFGLPDETSLDSSSSSGQRAPAHSLPTVNVRTNGNTKEYDRKFSTPSTPKSRPPLDPGFLDAPAELYAAASNAASLHPGSKYTVYLTAKFGVEEKFKSEMEKHVEASKRFPNLNSTYAYYKFPQAALDDSRFVQHRAFLGDPKDVSAKGGGYWFWKPLLTLHLLENLPDDTFVLYTDADQQNFLPLVPTLVDQITKDGFDFIVPQRANNILMRMQVWTKADVLDEMGIDTKPERVEVSLPDKNAWVPQVPAALRGQLSAQLWIVRNTPSVRAFFEAWVRCTSDWQLVSDTPSVSPNSKIFKGHRHDQAIMSALLSVKGMDTPHSFQIPKAWSQPHRWYRFKSSGANFSEFCTKPRPISHVSLQ